MANQSSTPRTAYIFRSRETLAMAKRDGFPEGGQGFAVMDSSMGKEFENIIILFEPTEDKEISALMSWHFCLTSSHGNMDLMDSFAREHDSIICIKC